MMGLVIPVISATRPKSRPTKFPEKINPMGYTDEKNNALLNNLGKNPRGGGTENRFSENAGEFWKSRRSKTKFGGPKGPLSESRGD